MLSEYNLLTFKAISTFTDDLTEIFGADNHSLKLYQRLLQKTTISHTIAINKHIEAFHEFCSQNRDALLNKDFSLLVKDKIEYSSKVYIDMKNIFKSADTETTDVIWKHLLTISAFVDPAGKAKEILKKTATSATKNEVNFLENIINKVETNVDTKNQNPMQAINSLMSSGVFNEIMSDMSSQMKGGNLDLNALLGTIEKVCSTIIPPSENGQSDFSSLLSSMGPLLNSIGQTNGTGDINSLVSNVLNAQASKTMIEEVKKA